VKAAERLPINELANLVQDLLSLQARRQAPVLSPSEADLLQKINQGLSPERQIRDQELIEKRLDETLTSAEYQELLQLNQIMEQLKVARLKSLVLLAQVRQTTVPQLMAELGIAEPQYVA
jgi:hypothetical protein